MKKQLSHTLVLILMLAILTLSGCVPGDGSSTEEDPAGFFSAIWHGWIAPVTLIWGLINPDIRVYEAANTGWWYDLGFYMAILGGFGGFSLTRKKGKKKSEDKDG